MNALDFLIEALLWVTILAILCAYTLLAFAALYGAVAVVLDAVFRRTP